MDVVGITGKGCTTIALPGRASDTAAALAVNHCHSVWTGLGHQKLQNKISGDNFISTIALLYTLEQTTPLCASIFSHVLVMLWSPVYAYHAVQHMSKHHEDAVYLKHHHICKMAGLKWN